MSIFRKRVVRLRHVVPVAAVVMVACWSSEAALGAPPNDNCASATAIGDGTFAFTTVGSNTDGPALPGSCDEGFGVSLVNDVWFRYTAPCTGNATVSLCGSGFDTRMAVYDTPCIIGALVACNDDFCVFQSQVTFPVTGGVGYLIRIGGFDANATGTGTLVTSCVGTPVVIGACCGASGVCTLETQVNCTMAGGIYQGDGMLCTPNPCPQPTGACCALSGTCTVVTQANCNAAGRTYQGDNSVCTPNPCPSTGACCAADSTCSIMDQAACVNAGGTYQGDNTVCTPNPCPPTGACCAADSTCSIMNQAACVNAGGTYEGDNTVCTPNPCPPPLTGACCAGNGTCTVDTQANCTAAGGTYQGDNSVCTPNPCPIPNDNCAGATPIGDGSFPFTTVGSNTDGPLLPMMCQEGPDALTFVNDVWFLYTAPCTGDATASLCTASGSFDTRMAVYDTPCIGALVTCNDDFCDVESEVTFAVIGGVDYLIRIGSRVETGTGTLVTSCAGPLVGACVDVSGACTVETLFDCNAAGGTYQGDGTDCPQPTGACCVPNGSCIAGATEGDCVVSGGTYQGNGTLCTPNPCPPTGACCPAAGTCSIINQAACVNAGGTYQGDNTFCTPDPCLLPNDNCASATAIRDGMFQFTTVGSNTDGPLLPATCQEGPNALTFVNDVWFLYTAPCTGDATASLCGSGFDTRMAVYDTPCIGALVACNDDLTGCGTDLQSEVTFAVIGGVDYLIRIGSRVGTGTGTLETSCSGPLVGACVDVSGACTVETLFDCNAASGTYLGDGTVCPSLTGACCLPSGSCIPGGTEVDCMVSGGTYQGDNSVCTPNPCPPPPTGACCDVSGTCLSDVTAGLCAAAGGTYQGDGTVCTPNPCLPPTGACCATDGTCTVVTQANCTAAGGAYQGDGASCTPNPCLQPTGACCMPNGLCGLDFTASSCAAFGGTYQGDNSVCTPNPCPQPTGACCLPDGSCVANSTQANCTVAGGAYQGNGTVCTPNPCPPPTGACCISGICFPDSTASACAAFGGTYQGNGTTCTSNPCVQPCSLPGDLNGDGFVLGDDIGGYLRAKLGQPPAAGENPACADFGTGTLNGDTALFVQSLLM